MLLCSVCYSADIQEVGDFASEGGNSATAVIKAIWNCSSKTLYASYLADICYFYIPLVCI